MLERAALPIADLLAGRRPGHGLAADLYVRPDIFEADLEVFFRRHWIFAALEIDVPEPGDVFTFDIGRSSVMIVRGDDEVVRAFHNTCRHRGARIAEAGPSTVGKLVCPYHQWTYELDGSLIDAPHMGACFDAGEHGLQPVALRAVAGLVFVCLSDEPPADFGDLEQALVERLRPFDLANAKPAFEKEIIEEGNWKLTIENNRECYHCAGSHPELSQSFIAQDFGFDPQVLSPQEQAAAARHRAECAAKVRGWEAAGFVSHAVEHLDGHVTNFRTERLVIDNAGQSHTMDTRIACRRLMGSIAEPTLGDLHLWTHNSWHHYFSDHAVISIVVPLSPGRTLVRSRWLVHKDAVEGVDYDIDRLTEVWIATNDQDAGLVARTQLGVLNPAYRPGPYSRFTEGYVDGFATWYVERLQAHGY